MAVYVLDLKKYPKIEIRGKYKSQRDANEYIRRYKGKSNILIHVTADSADEARKKAPKASRLPMSFFKK